MFTVKTTIDEVIELLNKVQEDIENPMYVETDEEIWNALENDLLASLENPEPLKKIVVGNKVEARSPIHDRLEAYKVTENGETKYYMLGVFLAMVVMKKTLDKRKNNQ